MARSAVSVADLLRASSIPALLVAMPVMAQEQPIHLPLVSVTANRVETPAAEVGSAVTIINGAELRQRQTQLVSDVLREVPGVAISRSGGVGSTTQVYLRGSENNQTLVLIDGIEVNDPALGSYFDFAHLLAADIERIEVLRGPQSALYGSDAAGGVINIVTRRGAGQPVVSGAFEAGSYNTYQANASVRGGGERYHFMLGGIDYRTSGISKANEEAGNRENDRYDNQTLFTKFGVSPTEILSFDFVGRYTYFDGEYDDFPASAAADSDDRTRGSYIYGRGQGKLALLDGRWEHILGAAYMESDSNSTGAFDGSNHGEKTKFDYQTNLLFDTPSFANASHTLTFLAEKENETFRSSFTTPRTTREIDSTGFVGMYKIGLFERLFLTGAVRQDQNDRFEDARTYRTTAAYLFPDSDTKLRASWGTGVKNPTMSELYGFTATYQGNPNLQPEESRGWDVGVDQGLLGGKVQVGATYFDQRIDNLIETGATSASNVDGESRIRGIELEVAARPVDRLTLRGSYTYMKTEAPETGEQLTRRPSQMASLNAHYRFADNRTSVNLGVLYNGRRVDNDYSTGFGANASRITLNGYALVNLGAAYKVTDAVEIYGRIENLLDKEYEEVYTYETLGRAGYVGVRATF
ncbi:MAG TPA: TonB-dependent receptor [Ferrovibrio sp.]|jgi:vitamin B12 transporter|uniref:TonB-dependent receptor plug domain-containing protein n=1 Tax=Ferrovibrio sp. TaxID=1917215 RepID=UPI002B4B78BC|nr:TonB-dependent receptor [Ferrovibrio sp.]HLT78543.1 TonB-dependent receptor [Ferrovibrio sp.]